MAKEINYIPVCPLAAASWIGLIPFEVCSSKSAPYCAKRWRVSNEPILAAKWAKLLVSKEKKNIYTSIMCIKVTGNALNIEYYFWWRDDCFGLLIHHDAPFHFMVSISDEYKYKRLVKTTFNSCGKPILLEIYHTCN